MNFLYVTQTQARRITLRTHYATSFMKIIDKYIENDDCTHFIRQLQVTENEVTPVLVFLHDALGSVEQWKQFPEKLAHACVCNAVIIERQGSGQSSPFTEKRNTDFLHHQAYEVLPKLLEKLHIKNPILIGHSDGGSIALLYASKFEVKAVVSIAAHVFLEQITLEGIRESMKHKDFLKLKLSKYHGEKTDALIHAWADTWLSDEFTDFNIEKELTNITTPTLVIQSEDDNYGTLRQVDSIFNNIQSKHKKKFIPKTGGHVLHLSMPDELAKEIKKFIENE